MRRTVLLTAIAAARIAFHVSPVHPRHYLGTLGSRFGNGFLDFYDYRLPFDARYHAGMEGVILSAVFGFVLALGIAIARRSAPLAVAVLLLGAGWPATLLAGGDEIFRGAVILTAGLVLLAGLTARAPLRLALPISIGVLIAAVAASSSPAIAKGQFLGWQHWDFYTRPEKAVSVSYVWKSTYTGIHFPRKATTVLEIRASSFSRYWRATTLDDFDGDGWLENLTPHVRLGPIDPLLPSPGRDRRHWRRAIVTVKALRDYHLIAGEVPVSYDAGNMPLILNTNGAAITPRGLRRDDQYTAWSYAPDPRLATLVRLPARYPPALLGVEAQLQVAPGVTVPVFGTPDRAHRMERLFKRYAYDRTVAPYEALYRRAVALTRGASTPYAAAVAIESWLRRGGGFVYDETPPLRPNVPPLVAFVTDTRAGYCQHFAGAMAVMLRYVGIPARVAAGFVSGTYDNGTWKVTDHDAHTWVEVWFPRYGWLPFDPTPGRGELAAAYSASSRHFDPNAILRLSKKSGFEIHLERTRVRRTGVKGGPDTPQLGQRGTGGGVTHPIRNLLRGIAFVLFLGLALVLLAKTVVRRVRFLTRDPRRLASGCRRELADFLADQGVPVPPSATLDELGAIVREQFAVDASSFVDAATTARFGPRPDAQRALVELHELERRIRAGMTRTERIRGVVSLRSLGFS